MKHNSSVKEQSLRPAAGARAQGSTTPTVKSPQELDERMLMTLRAAGDKKGVDPIVLDLREIASFTDYFIIVSGTNERQVQAISDEVYERLKHAGTSAARVEGYKTAEWILLDYGDFVVHVFGPQARSFYDLERLWREARQVPLPPELTNTPSSLRTES
ncbi:MAG TPA: ribosome silencing factor [Pyrinomonadaceae bacterium]|nr:ribosome silencing factor [Pyrinomonadaceae bacterium]